jgi:hypothetical protein
MLEVAQLLYLTREWVEAWEEELRWWRRTVQLWTGRFVHLLEWIQSQIGQKKVSGFMLLCEVTGGMSWSILTLGTMR